MIELGKCPASLQLKILYTNWEGKENTRRIKPIKHLWGSNDWHKEPQLFLNALDLDRDIERDFAVKDIKTMKVLDGWLRDMDYFVVGDYYENLKTGKKFMCDKITMDMGKGEFQARFRRVLLNQDRDTCMTLGLIFLQNFIRVKVGK